jgi:ribosomal protein L12E/L44/L45/RPP1/RPP2
MVHLLVYKKDLNKFAKIEEQIPAGFEARAMESKDGLFTFKDGIAKFVWMNLPTVEAFKISYRLIPEAGQTEAEARITGVLSYIQEGRNVTVDVVQQEIDLASVTDDNIGEVIASLGAGTAVAAAVPDRKEVEPADPDPQRTDPVLKEDPVVQEKETVRSQPASGSSGIPADQLLPVYDGVYFRVQLAATRRFQDAPSLFNKYRLSRKVLVEKQAGLFKYTAGSFSNYTQARGFKDTAVSRGLRDAFVVAYRDGQRIDILDALQATGGK